jgi:hypothetical protein
MSCSATARLSATWSSAVARTLATSRSVVEVSSSASRRAVASDRVRFPLGGSAQVAGFPLGTRPQFRGLILDRSPQFGRVRLGRSLQLLDGGSGLTADLGGQLFGKPQQLLIQEPKTRLGRALALPQLALRDGQLTPQRLRLIPVLAGPVFQPLDLLVHLMAVIAAEHHVEHPGGWLPGDVTGLGINPGIHALHPPITRRDRRNLS